MPVIIPGGEYITSPEAARRLGITHRAWQMRRHRAKRGYGTHPAYISLGCETLYLASAIERMLHDGGNG